MSTDYDDLAARAERGELKVIPGTERHGAAATQAAREELLAASGATSPEEFMRMAIGRPRG